MRENTNKTSNKNKEEKVQRYFIARLEGLFSETVKDIPDGILRLCDLRHIFFILFPLARNNPKKHQKCHR